METLINVGNRIDLCLSAGKVLRTPSEEDNRKIYKSKIYDIIDETMIKAAMPTQEGRLILLPLDSVYDIYFYTSAGVYECEGKVVERYKENNLFIIILELLEPLKRNQRREYYRLSCTINAKFLPVSEAELKIGGIDKIIAARAEREKVKSEEDEESSVFDEVLEADWKEGYIIDISGGGIRFTSDEVVEDNSYIYAKFDLMVGGQIKQYTILTQVISSEELLNRTKQYETRAKFIGVGRDKTEEIIKYIFKEERKSRKNRKS